MSFAHEMRVLDLESQIELLERIRLLTRFGSNLISLSGPQGCGKTWIAQRFLEAYAQDKNQSLLMCHPNQTDDQKRTILLNQVVVDPLFNESDSIINSFTRMVQDNTCDLVLVIDDAHQLSDTLLAELWTLILEAQSNPKWNINVVLFSDSNSLDQTLSRLSYGQELKPISLEIEPLRPNEVETFLEMMVLKFVHENDAKKKVRKAVKKTPALPGALMALGERKVERKIIIRSIVGSPLKIAVLVIALLLLIAGGYLWFFMQPDPALPEVAEKTVTEINEQEQTSVVEDIPSSPDKMVLSANGDSNMKPGTPEKTQADDTVIIDDVDALPQPVTSNIVSVGSNDDGQRVIVPSNVVDALLEGETPEGAKVIDDAVEDVKQQAREENTAQSVQPDVTAERDETAPPLITFSFAKDELLAIPDTHYTLQLAALVSLEQVQDFILVHELENKVRIYPTVRAGTKWYIVTYQDFVTIQDARNARETLPPSVKILEPWAKSMLQVHREIRRAN